MATCYNTACPYCTDYQCRRTCTCDKQSHAKAKAEFEDGSAVDVAFRMASEIRTAVGIGTLKECYEATRNGSIRRVKHGAWGENIYGYRKCSVCGRVTQVDECMREPLYLYCPYCGSRMDEVKE